MSVTGRAVFLRFSFVSASLSDIGGFAGCWVMAVRGVASHKPSSSNGKGLEPLTLVQRVLLVFVINLKPQGLSGVPKFLFADVCTHVSLPISVSS